MCTLREDQYKSLYCIMLIYSVCTQLYDSTVIYIHSDHIMATCFDRETVIIRTIKNIFKVKQSEH